MNLHFLNYHHNGDIHYSKEFMRDMYNIIQPSKCFLHHQMKPGVLKDMPFIEQQPPLEFEENSVMDDDIYIVTWIGHYFINGSISSAMGCSIYSNYLAFRNIYKELGLEDQMKNLEHYIPTVDYTKIEKHEIDKFCLIRTGKKVLISNGNVLSGQSENFDFSGIIDKLSTDFPLIDFILTHETLIRKPNVFYTSGIIHIDGCDLNEISYLSLKCDVTIGRASGPIAFTHVKENFADTKMIMIGISNSRPESFWYMPEKNGCKQVWTNNYDLNHIYNFIKQEIQQL